MDVSKVRHRNFMALFKQFRDQNSHLPDRGMLTLFAEKLGISARFLSHIKCDRKNMGHAIARQIEEALRLQHGWMDREHTDLEPRDMPERVFMESMLALFRSNPVEAQSMMVAMLKERLKN